MAKAIKRNSIMLQINGALIEADGFRNIAFSSLRFICYVGISQLLFGSAFEAYYYGSTLAKVNYRVTTALLAMGCLARLRNCERFKKELSHMIDKFESGLSERFRFRDEEKKILNLLDESVCRQSMVFALATFSCCVCWTSSPIVEQFLRNRGVLKGNSPMTFPFPAMYPFPTSNSGVFWTCYIMQVHAGVSMWSIWIGSDLFFMSTISHLCGHLQVLGRRMRNVIAFHVGTDRPIRTYEDDYRDIEDIILYHRELFLIVDKVEQIFNQIFLLLMVAVALVIACCGFEMILSKADDEGAWSLISILMLWAITSSLFLCCWFGTKLTTESQSLADELYFSEWTEMIETRKKMLLFILHRTQKPMALTAGKYCKLSLSSFLDIMKLSYSILALFKEMID